MSEWVKGRSRTRSAALNLPDGPLAPCELKAEKVTGSDLRLVAFHIPGGLGSHKKNSACRFPSHTGGAKSPCRPWRARVRDALHAHFGGHYGKVRSITAPDRAFCRRSPRICHSRLVAMLPSLSHYLQRSDVFCLTVGATLLRAGVLANFTGG